MPMRPRFGLSFALIAALVLGWPGPALAQDERADPPKQDEPQRDRPARPEQPGRRPERPRPGRLNTPASILAVPEVVYATTTNPDGSSSELTMNVFFPKDSGDEPLPAIVYIHGGGFTGGNKNIGNTYSSAIAEGGYLTATIGYRLLGEAPFPAALHDVKAAIRFLRANAEELGIDPDRIGVWGHSAGGHLAAYLGTSGNSPETNGEVGGFGDEVSAEVTCVVDFFGPSDFVAITRINTRRGRQLTRQILGGEVDDAEALLRDYSPISWADADDPPFLIIHGTKDRVVSIEQSRMLDQALSEAGASTELLEIEGAGHGIRSPEVLGQAMQFFDKHLGGRATEATSRYLERLGRPSDRQVDRPAGGG